VSIYNADTGYGEKMKLPALREIVEERKEKAIENLSTSYAKNKLPLEEYERLVEYINKIESERELLVVEKIVAEYDGGELPKENEDSREDNKPDYYAGRNPPQSSNLTLLSSRVFSGPLKSGSQFVSILGSEHIKIRKADLTGKQTVLDVVSILGDSVIFVESGIMVSNRVIPVLGGAWTDHEVGKQARESGPEIIISGTALLGNVTVKLLKE
jgi:hypothetical protein